MGNGISNDLVGQARDEVYVRTYAFQTTQRSTKQRFVTSLSSSSHEFHNIIRHQLE